MREKLRKVLTIAGSDPCGGAGIQADLKTFQALGVYGMAVITALTVQNTKGVKATNIVGGKIVAEQLEFLLADIEPDALKTGMLGNKEIVAIVAEKLAKFKVKNLVVDPIVFASDGTPLLDEEGVKEIKRLLLPLATVVTPNLREAGLLCGFEVKNIDDMLRAAEELIKFGVHYPIITGGHLPRSEQAVDLLFDGRAHSLLPGFRLGEETDIHGTGCVFSAALTAFLSLEEEVITAAKKAKEFVSQAIRNAVRVGKGRPQTNTVF